MKIRLLNGKKDVQICFLSKFFHEKSLLPFEASQDMSGIKVVGPVWSSEVHPKLINLLMIS